MNHKQITTPQDQAYHKSVEIQRQLNELDENDPLRDELLDELEEARLNEDEEVFGSEYVKLLRKVLKP